MKEVESNKTEEWNEAYKNKDNFVFYPHEEVIRFISKYFCKKVGFDKFELRNSNGNLVGLDLGCGIGRHVKYLSEMGIEAYGIDLSETAINYAKKWLKFENKENVQQNLIQGSITEMPFDTNYFDLVVSHGVLDSMPFEIAYHGMKETHRCMKVGGLFYFDIISGDDKKRYREYFAEEVVETEHEKGTIQTYYNWKKVEKLIDLGFELIEAQLIKKESLITHDNNSRYHIILKKAK